MELDDLRRRWQQPEPSAPAALPGPALQELLSRQSGSLVARMRRNARAELTFTVLLMLVMAGFLLQAKQAFYQMYTVFMLLLGAATLYYFYRKLRILRRMDCVEGDVQGHLQRLAASLRQLLAFYYRLTLFTGPWALLMALGFNVGRELARAEPFRWGRLGIMAGFVLVFGTLLQVVAVYVTRWYMQRLYGQHLDRLEAALRDLGDEK
ncbi:hypothetical protein [Hymenobacter cellulosilyticus]|uniref:Uncharacterized protein n=1 Tax=Hymenobacter cellulosilyticus TaxID=2932248 RepID=A0A8T9QA48_9BACT|nr:hypothetical protein [Hymenobacter cellulosilyticus]UOQ74446.1 hypothetical protein MUN79_11520 [Hymenobacter cellulosilyticus]